MPFYRKQGNSLEEQDTVTITLTTVNKNNTVYQIADWYWFADTLAAQQHFKKFIYAPGSEEYNTMIKELRDRC